MEKEKKEIPEKSHPKKKTMDYDEDPRGYRCTNMANGSCRSRFRRGNNRCGFTARSIPAVSCAISRLRSELKWIGDQKKWKPAHKIKNITAALDTARRYLANGFTGTKKKPAKKGSKKPKKGKKTNRKALKVKQEH